MTCLDISVPSLIQDLRCKPPYCISDDIHANPVNHLIQKFGRKHGRGEEEIEKACCLARGPSDIVVMLERPNRNQKYDVSFEDFISNCPTLRAVDDLIRYSSMGARSIHTVTVLDAFPFMPEHYGEIFAKRHEVNGQCHELIEQILNLKKPKVVICCWRGPDEITTENVILKQLESRGVGSWPIRDEAKDGQMTLIRSFHPAVSVCYRTDAYWTRLLLICHFVMAFAELKVPLRHHSWLQDICKKSKKYVYGNTLLRMLTRLREGNNEPRSQKDIESSVLQHLRRTLIDKKACRTSDVSDTYHTMTDDVNFLLRQLLASEYTGSIHDITSLRLIWQNYQHPLRQAVSIRLREIESRLNLPPSVGKPVNLPKSSRYIGFTADLESSMERLQLNESQHQAIVPGAHDRFRELQLSLEDHRKIVSGYEFEVARLSSQVDLSIKFGLNIFSPDVIDLSAKIHELPSDLYDQLNKTATFVSSIPTRLEQMLHPMNEEDQSQCCPVDHSCNMSIVNQAIRDTHITASITFRVAMRLCGLLALQTFVNGIGIDGQTLVALQRQLRLTSMVQLLRTGMTKMLEFRAMIDISETKPDPLHEYPSYSLKRTDGSGLCLLYGETLRKLCEEEARRSQPS